MTTVTIVMTAGHSAEGHLAAGFNLSETHL
jgi:hypothetical protein